MIQDGSARAGDPIPLDKRLNGGSEEKSRELNERGKRQDGRKDRRYCYQCRDVCVGCLSSERKNNTHGPWRLPRWIVVKGISKSGEWSMEKSEKKTVAVK